MKNWLVYLLGAAGFGAAAWCVQGTRREEQMFRDLLQGLTSGPSPQEVSRRIAERAATLVGGSAAYVERLDVERDEIIAAAVHNGHGLSEGTRGPYRGSAAEQAIQTRGAIIVDDIGRESHSILSSVRGIQAVVLPLISDEGPIGALIVLQGKRRINTRSVDRLQTMADVTAIALRRAIVLERLQHSLHVREELQRVLAHDLRNPINTVALAAFSLSHAVDFGEKEERLVEMIRRSTQRMTRLIQDLLDTAVIEQHGELPLNTQDHPAHTLAEEVCELTRMQATPKTVRVQCEIQGNATVCVDRDRVLQVLGNLIDNAIKFTPEGGTVTVRSEVAGQEVRFSVSDTGPGIPEAERDRVFEPYWQSSSTAHLGAGLGLSIAKQIVEQHGGRIWVESAVGLGSTFVFAIPANLN